MNIGPNGAGIYDYDLPYSIKLILYISVTALVPIVWVFYPFT